MVKGLYRRGQRLGIVATSDGAGEVVEVGSRVSRFALGDKVLTTFHQGHIYGVPDAQMLFDTLGGAVDGPLTQYGIYNEQNIVRMPQGLNYLEGSTLCQSGITAWNSLYGLKDKALKAGDWVLVQGSGGVSIFGLQFAKAAGAKVIATTSSPEKAEKLKQLGADHVINYKEDPNWGETAKKLTPGGEGVHHVIEVGGPQTVAQSFKAVRTYGNIAIVGFLAGYDAPNQSWLDPLNYGCSVFGVLVGSREQFEDMNRAIEANNIRPVVDKKVFKLEEAREAYDLLASQNVFGKLCIQID
jgi:NADPH:quinone reductase-like Zn-dependent oxidoreductase